MKHLPEDVSRCTNPKCSMAQVCARYMCRPKSAKWLWFAGFEPDSSSQCQHFIFWDKDHGVMDKPENLHLTLSERNKINHPEEDK